MSSETDVLLVLTNLPDADSADRVTKVVLESAPRRVSIACRRVHRRIGGTAPSSMRWRFRY